MRTDRIPRKEALSGRIISPKYLLAKGTYRGICSTFNKEPGVFYPGMHIMRARLQILCGGLSCLV
jgi:hypothetical protein